MPWRKLRTVAAALLLSAGVLGIGTAHGDDNASQFCKSINDGGLGHGACVSLAHGNATPSISELCKIEGVPEFFGTTNHGQCIKAVRAAVAGA
jgi:hypothetical protein